MMNRTRYKVLHRFLVFLFLVVYFIHPGNVVSQELTVNSSSKTINTFLLNKRLSDLFNYSVNGNIYKATRFIPIYSLRGIEEWTAPSSTLLIDGIPYMKLPFNFNSIDMLPLDINQVKEIKIIRKPSVGSGYSSSVGSVDIISEPIPDSLSILFRGYFGGVTGDPLIHIFTKPELRPKNKNKIVPSGVLSIANKISSFSYRFTTGYYGYFSAGFGNDDILRNINRRLLGKQNKQILASFEAEYDLNEERKLKLFSSFINYYGWEVTPFITSFAHLESYLYTVRLTAVNLWRGFNITFKRDAAISEIDEANTMSAAKISLSEVSVYPTWSAKYNDFLFRLYSDINYYSANNLSNGIANTIQNYFDEDINKWTFGIGVHASYNFTKSLSNSVEIRGERNINQRMNYSGEISSSFSIDKINTIGINLSSVVRSPNLTELFGQFKNYGFRNTGSPADTFSIMGNSALREERGNSISLNYNHSNTNNSLKISSEIYYYKVQRPIKQNSTDIIRTIYPGAVYRSAVYGNSNSKSLYGVYLSLYYDLISSIGISTAYSFTENSNYKSSPRNRFILKTEVRLPFKGIVSAVVSYFSKSIWDDFIVEPQNDYLLGSGKDGTIPSFTTLDIFYEQKINNIIFMKEFNFRLAVTNIFNRTVRYLPVGNEIERAVVITLLTTF